MTTTPIHSPGPQPSEVNATAIAADRDEPCDEAMISKQRQRYLVSLLSDQEQQSDSRYREQ
jgi:hypothetical protein